jgi:hypothetical protein
MSAGAQNKITVVDTTDFDVTSLADLRIDQEDRSEPGMLFNGTFEDMHAYFNVGDPGGPPQISTMNMAQTASAAIGVLEVAGASTVVGPVALVLGANTLVGAGLQMASDLQEMQAYNDPYDPNYKTVYSPASPKLPATSVAAGVPAIIVTDELNFVTTSAKVASYADAVYVTQNRMLSAGQDGDMVSFDLQNGALNKYVGLLGAAHTAHGNAANALANDLTINKLDDTVTPAQISSFISSVKTGGFAALPQQEQDIINQFVTDPTDKAAIVTQITTINAASAPTSLVASLHATSAAANSLGTIYSHPADLAALPPPPAVGPHDVKVIGSHDQYVIAKTSDGQGYVQDTIAGRNGTQTIAGLQHILFSDGTGDFDPTGAAEDVTRLYLTAFNRFPDVAGLDNNTNSLTSGTVSLAALANGFAGSPEFIHTYGTLDNPGFVTNLYQNALHRPPDAPGVQTWLAYMANGASRGDVLTAFAESAENRINSLPIAGDVDDAEAYRLYQAALNRAPDATGLAFWSNALRNGATVTQLAEGFESSAEFLQKYGALSTTDFVTQLYRNALGRAPDASGEQNWVNAINNGMTRAQVLVGFSDSTENRVNTASATHDAWVFTH